VAPYRAARGRARRFRYRVRGPGGTARRLRARHRSRSIRHAPASPGARSSGRCRCPSSSS